MSPEAYGLHDGRFVEEQYRTCAANALIVNSGIVPAGKVWTILSALVYPSVAETRTVHLGLVSRYGTEYPVTIPVSIALVSTIPLPLLTYGMEIKLFPGDKLYARRDVATAGSTMTIIYRYIENDLPYYSYEDPLKKVIAQPLKHGSIFRPGGGGGGGGGFVPPGGGGGGGPKPI